MAKEINNSKNLVRKCYHLTHANILKIQFLAKKHGYSEGLTINKLIESIKI